MPAKRQARNKEKAGHPFFAHRPHPWHGIEVGPDPPRVVNAYIEITPFDLAKYEIDKATGYLRLDRPQFTSSLPPCLYGFVPRTLCGPRVARLSRLTDKSDDDPADICIFSELSLGRPEVLITARIIGGMHFVDLGEADDKLIAVPEHDNLWGRIQDVAELPAPLLLRLEHYFTTYKQVPHTPRAVEFGGCYGRQEAWKVLEAAMEDYRCAFRKPSRPQTRS